MKKSLTPTLVAIVCLATMATAAAQTKSASRPAPRRHSEVHHKPSNVTVPDESKKLNSDLAKLETQTSKSMKPSRAKSEQKVAVAKSAAPQGRRSNPPINFTYSGHKSASTTHGGGASRGASGPKLGTRMK